MVGSAKAKSEHEERIGRTIALLSVSVGAVLAVLKIAIGLHVGSTALVSDGFEGTGDVLSSGFVYAGLWLASRPPDAEHPYGHGRYETLAGLAVGALLLLTGAAIFWNGVMQIHERNALQPYALYPLFAAFVLKFALAGTKLRIGKRMDSSALQADGWHDITDLVSTFVAFVAVLLTLADPARFGMADHLGGMLIGAIIFFLSIKLVLRTVGQLVDAMPEPQRMAQLRAAALFVPGAIAVEKCFARRAGMKYYVDLHLEVDPDLTVRESHDIAREVKRHTRNQLNWVADVLVHVEPATTITLAARGASGSHRYLDSAHGE